MDQVISTSTERAEAQGGRDAATPGAAGGGVAGSACPACGASVAAETVSTALWQGESLIVVRDVPALVCRGCHERYFGDDTAMRLDLIRAGRIASAGPVAQMTVPVFRFPATGRGPE